MPALKLFVSHSSRLDGVAHKYTDDDANWRLLRRTCAGLKACYEDDVQMLVDRDGLVGGDDWNRELNLWLAECHAAVILFSSRALTLSDWVKKEAAILGWRAALDPDFTLIPVTLEGESTSEDLAKGYFGALDIGRIQCVHADPNADDIVAKVSRRLGKREEIAAEHAKTPLDLLQGGIKKILADNVTADSIAAALEAVGSEATSDRVSNRERYAELLARRLLQTSLDKADACFRTFQRSFGELFPKLPKHRAYELLAVLRSLWVHPGAAAHLATALERNGSLALAAQLIMHGDPELGAKAYTTERYLERVWPKSADRKLVTILAKDTEELDRVRESIREAFFGRLPPGTPRMIVEQRDDEVRLSDKRIILVVDCRKENGGLPSPEQRLHLQRLSEDYAKLLLIFGMEPTDEPLPDTITPVRPSLEPLFEARAYLAERSAAITLRDSYAKNQADGT